MVHLKFSLLYSLLIFSLYNTSFASAPTLINGELNKYTGISEFRLVNRRLMGNCPDPNPNIDIKVSTNSSLLHDEGFVTVTVSGVIAADKSDWVAMISPTSSDVSACPWDIVMSALTGDTSSLPLLCHYPIKAQYLSNDPSYLSCDKSECSGSITFHYVNIRTDIEFVFFTGGFETPCMLKRSQPCKFANPKHPLYGHLSSVDSTGTSMRLTWISGDKSPQQIQYGDGKSATSLVTTFTQSDMCSEFNILCFHMEVFTFQ